MRLGVNVVPPPLNSWCQKCSGRGMTDVRFHNFWLCERSLKNCEKFRAIGNECGKICSPKIITIILGGFLDHIPQRAFLALFSPLFALLGSRKTR